MQRAYLTYVIIHDDQLPPIIAIHEFPSEPYATAVGRGLQELLTKATATRAPMKLYWCVTTAS